METGIPNESVLRIELPSFEGPLDLLLHLIKKHELDILDLPIAFVAERYLHYLSLMQQLDLNIASEYLLMAATLAHIKSKMLLPTPPSDQGDDEEVELEDPRADLIRRLLEYQKYKEAAEFLGNRPVIGRDVFWRGTPSPKFEGNTRLAETGLFKLLDAFEQILKRIEDRQAFEVSVERFSIRERINQLTELLQEKRSCCIDELFERDHSRYLVVVTFLAILEMAKMRIVRIYQADYETPIYLNYALLDADAPTVPPESSASDSEQKSSLINHEQSNHEQSFTDESTDHEDD